LKVDRAVIFSRLDTIERNTEFLDEYKEFSTEEFTSSYKDVQADSGLLRI